METFTAWKAKFDKEMSAKKNREEDEKLKGLSIKERDEVKKLQLRSTGELFSFVHDSDGISH